MADEFKDLFSNQSADYAKFRPSYPDSLFRYLASLAPGRKSAWDCATGNGQAAVKLADHFDRVVATDASERQLGHALPHPKVRYRVAAAEDSGLNDRAVDLITVAQAFHWLRRKQFFREATRVLKPGGVLAIWCYEMAEIAPEIDALLWRFYKRTLDGCWEKERRLVEEGYRNEPFPFEEIKPRRFEMTARWSLEQLVGYLGTWSAVGTFIKRNGRNPLEPLYGELKEAWGAVSKRAARWDLALRVGRNV